MATYRNIETGEIRELDPALIAAWQAVGNAKGDLWEPFTPEPPPPPPPTPDWATFKTVALNSATLNQIQAAAYQTAPVAAGSLAAALLLADGNGWADFAAAWAKICAAVPVAPEVIAGFQQVAESCHLPEAFVEALQPSSPQAAAQPPVT